MRHFIATVAAALCFWWGAISALPQYPNSIPWPHWVSVAAVAGVLATYMLWFHIASWAINRGSNFQNALIRRLTYLAALMGLVTVVFAPLLPAYSIFGLCRLGLDCGERAQGAFNVLHAAAFGLKVYVALPVCILFVCAVIPISRYANSRKSAA